MGISIKLDPTDRDGTEERYKLKGLTAGYVTEEAQHAYNNDLDMSKK